MRGEADTQGTISIYGLLRLFVFAAIGFARSVPMQPINRQLTTRPRLSDDGDSTSGADRAAGATHASRETTQSL